MKTASPVNAWILDTGGGHRIAVAEAEMIEFLPEAVALEVPLSPHYCPAVTPWRERLLPLVHYRRLFETADIAEPRHVGVLAYQLQPGEALRYLALSLSQPPYRIAVSDEESDDLPERYTDPAFRPMVRAVFRQHDEAVPVIDVAYLASADLRDALHERQEIHSPVHNPTGSRR